MSIYDELPESYVIFICLFDPFYQGLPRYEFREICADDTSIELKDETHKVFINARSDSPDISDEMRALLDYLCGKDPRSELTKDIDASIASAKRDRKWERDYVQFGEIMKIERKAGREEGLKKGRALGRKEGRLEGREEGREEGHAELARVNMYLLGQKRFDDLSKANEDEEFFQTILNEMKDAGLFVSDDEAGD